MDIVTKIKFEQGIISDSAEALRTGILMQKPEVPEDDKKEEEDKK